MAAYSTRLQRQPARRVQYSDSAQRALHAPESSLANPVEIEDPPALEVTVPSRTRRGAEQANGYSGVKKSKAAPKKALKVPPPIKKVKPMRECSLCASTKVISTYFKLDGNEDACEHFRDICSRCMDKIVTGHIKHRQLNETGLACVYPNCDHVLDFSLLKTAVYHKTTFNKYDAALTKHLLAVSPNFIACLNTDCGQYFSIEDCTGTDAPMGKTKGKGKAKVDEKAKKLITCPYCDCALCMTCNRPWHPETHCSKAQEAEDKACLDEIKKLGAKPCPQCDVNIEKQGGCDHMTCKQCRHNFCWQCLVPFDGRPHAQGCMHAVRPNIGDDREDWAPENATVEQINVMFEQARRRADNNWVGQQQLGQGMARAQAAILQRPLFPPPLEIRRGGAAGPPALQIPQNIIQQMQGLLPVLLRGGGGATAGGGGRR